MLYAIAGNGTGPTKEITGALKDLKDEATKADAEFWIILEGKDEPSQTDTSIIAWMTKNEIWFEVYTSSGTTIEAAQETYGTDDVFASMMERMQERLQDDEPATLLVLLTDDEAEDEAVGVLVEQAIDGEVPVLQLNGELAPITLENGEGEPEPEPEPEPVKAATKKAAAPAKKAAAKATGATKKAAATVEEPDMADVAGEPGEEPTEVVVYTPEELAKMTVAELGAVARSQGIDPKGMGKRDLIDSVKSKMAPEVVVAPVASTNGDVLVVVHYNNSVITKMVPAVDALALIAQ